MKPKRIPILFAVQTDGTRTLLPPPSGEFHGEDYMDAVGRYNDMKDNWRDGRGTDAPEELDKVELWEARKVKVIDVRSPMRGPQLDAGGMSRFERAQRESRARRIAEQKEEQEREQAEVNAKLAARAREQAESNRAPHRAIRTKKPAA